MGEQDIFERISSRYFELTASEREGPLQAGSVEARIAQLFVMDLLFTEICRLDPEGTAARQERVAEALARKHL